MLLDKMLVHQELDTIPLQIKGGPPVQLSAGQKKRGLVWIAGPSLPKSRRSLLHQEWASNLLRLESSFPWRWTIKGKRLVLDLDISMAFTSSRVCIFSTLETKLASLDLSRCQLPPR